MRMTPRIARMLLCCAALLQTAPASAASLKRITIPPNAFSPLMSQQTDSRMGFGNGSAGGDVFFWATLDLPVGATIKGMSYSRLASIAASTVVGLDRVQPGKAPAWERVLEAASTDITPPAASGTVVIATPTAVSRKVAKNWKYFVLVKTAPGAFVGDVKIKYIVP